MAAILVSKNSISFSKWGFWYSISSSYFAALFSADADSSCGTEGLGFP